MDNKLVFALIMFFFNSLGIPCFLLGKTKAGALQLILGFVTFGIIAMVNSILGIIAAIKVFCMTDAEFAAANKESLLLGFPAAK